MWSSINEWKQFLLSSLEKKNRNMLRLAVDYCRTSLTPGCWCNLYGMTIPTDGRVRQCLQNRYSIRHALCLLINSFYSIYPSHRSLSPQCVQIYKETHNLSTRIKFEGQINKIAFVVWMLEKNLIDTMTIHSGLS
jgi:hypothetical protein